MLRLLDAYVLDALGALDSATASSMVAMTGTLSHALKASGSNWQEIIESAMEMPPGSRDELRELWEQHVHETSGAGNPPDVIAFAHALVDARFQS